MSNNIGLGAAPLDQRDPAVAAPQGLKRAGIIGVVVALAVVAAGTYSRVEGYSEAQKSSEAVAIPTVHLIAPKVRGEGEGLVLPGTVEAWNDAKIYARIPGYVRAWYKDIGAEVSAGTPLGSIDTPELDQQIIQARAALGRVKAERSLARSTAMRWNDLLSSSSVSQQEADEKNGNYTVQVAAVREAEANLGRLLAMKAYATLRAPFSGVVTARNADIGDLVGPGSTNQQPLFSMADEHRIRIYVGVPQQYSALIHPGQAASLTVPDYPKRTFTAQIIGSSESISSRTGAQQVQLVTTNSEGLLKAGSYAQVKFDLPPIGSAVTIPASALILRSSGTTVATVGTDGRIRLLPIVLGRDLGGTVEVTSGLDQTTKIIDNPLDSLSNGELVKVQNPNG